MERSLPNTFGAALAGRPDLPGRDGQSVLESMKEQGIALSSENFLVWSAYADGSNPHLRRAIDMVLTNGRTLDDRDMRHLYAGFCSPLRESAALREASGRARETLRGITSRLYGSRGGTSQYCETLPPIARSLNPLVRQLADETAQMIALSERVADRLEQSGSRIEELEKFLDDARRDATTDGLTGLANRRAFDSALRDRAGEAMNSGDELSCLILDIDLFKQVNDRYGHPCGDAVLARVAQILSGCVRGNDTVARYGGEEFAAILPATSARGAMSVAENLRAAIEQPPKPEAGRPQIPITVSVGVACYDFGEKLEEWVARADTALYWAKQAGRNRIAFAAAIGQETPASGGDDEATAQHPAGIVEYAGLAWGR